MPNVEEVTLTEAVRPVNQMAPDNTEALARASQNGGFLPSRKMVNGRGRGGRGRGRGRGRGGGNTRSGGGRGGGNGRNSWDDSNHSNNNNGASAEAKPLTGGKWRSSRVAALKETGPADTAPLNNPSNPVAVGHEAIPMEDRDWYYVDPKGDNHGPYRSHEMRGWYEHGFFKVSYSLSLPLSLYIYCISFHSIPKSYLKTQKHDFS